MKKIKIILVFGLFFFFSFLTPVLSQTPTPIKSGPTVSPSPSPSPSPTLQASPSPVKDVETTKISGQVIRISNRTLTIQAQDGVKEVNIPQNIRITRNGISANFDGIKTGDLVEVTVSDKGQVLSIDAISREVVDWSRWIIPAVIIGLVLVLLALYLWERSRRGHIKTTSEK
jgi:hypothetical protein